MSEKSRPQYARVEQPFGCEFPIVHCPICGKATTKAGEDGPDPNHTPCKHLAFIYLGEIGQFVYESDDFKNRSKDVDAEDLDFDSFEEYLQKAEYDNKLIAIELTHGGMACGPVWYTEVFGFDYGTLADKEKS